MIDWHQSEESFWFRMNPARLYRLSDARAKLQQAAEAETSAQRSLGDYLMTGGD